MRRYDDPVEVRRGLLPGATGPVEGPEQFVWKGRLWKVCAVVAHWVETGAWWQSHDGAPPGGQSAASDLLGEREVWRVEAAHGRAASAAGGRGVFDLAFDWTRGGWQLARCLD